MALAEGIGRKGSSVAKQPKQKGEKAEDKQGASRRAFGHDINTSYDGEGSWSCKIFYDNAHRHTITGLRFEGDARWAGEDWAHLNRVLVGEAKLVGRDFLPIILDEKGEVARLGGQPTEIEALDYAAQYIEQLRAVDRVKVAKKQAARAEYILKMEEFDAIEAGFEQKIANAKEGLKLAQERRADWVEASRNPQCELNFVFDRRRARQTDIEDVASRLGNLPEKPDPTSPGAVLLSDCLEDATKAVADKAAADAEADKAAKAEDKGDDGAGKRPRKRPPPRPGADAEETTGGEAHP